MTPTESPLLQPHDEQVAENEVGSSDTDEGLLAYTIEFVRRNPLGEIRAR